MSFRSSLLRGGTHAPIIRWMGDRTRTTPKTAPEGASTADAPIGELDRVRIDRAVLGDDDVRVPPGSTGTVVAVYASGAAFEVEFTEPVDTLATVDAGVVRLVERAGG